MHRDRDETRAPGGQGREGGEMRRWIVLMWDGPLLYAAIGPFGSYDAARAWNPRDDDERKYKRTVVELFMS